MKLAIVGPHCPMAEQFIDYLRQEKVSWELSFYHLSDRSPLIEFLGKEYPVLPLDEDEIGLDYDAYLFFPQEDYRELMLTTEAKGAKVLDCTGTFVNEPTVPLVMPPINEKLVHKHNLLCLPSFGTALIIPILWGLDQRFRLKRVSILSNEKKPSNLLFHDDEYSDDEINSINEVSKILDNDCIRYTVSHFEEKESKWKDYFFNLEFSRPFNVEDLLSQLLNAANVYSKRDVTKGKEEHELILRRYRRDLSLDSGIHMWISTQDPKLPLLRGIYEILSELETG